jgi:glycosyltransferase involved in cell wall biosynthesis
MRLVIDMQGAQTASRFPDIGRFTMSIVEAMVQQRGAHDVFLVLNGAYGETIEPIRAAFDRMLPQNHIRVFEVAGPVDGHDAANDARRKAAELMREAFLASVDADVVLIPSLFEEGDAVTSVGALGRSIPTAVILHDMTPSIYSDVYLQDPAIQRWYFNKLDHLRRADLLLSVSESAGREAIEHLNFPQTSAITISRGCAGYFGPSTLTEAQNAYLRNAYGIDGPFVMYRDGNEHEKNIDGLFKAFAGLPQSIRAGTRLVIVGREFKEDHGRLTALAGQVGLEKHEVIFTGYVADEEVVLFYNACTLFVYPSWHEGFCLPVLEAMACGCAVIATNASSLYEVVGRKDSLFPPCDNAAMTAKMAEVLSNAGLRAELERHGLEQAKKFSWKISARRAWGALLALYDSKKPSLLADEPAPRRPRLAYVSPLPPERTGIADYSAELLPELARYYDIEVVVAQHQVSDQWVVANTPVRDVAWFRNHAHHFDRVVYQFGNSPFHSHMFDLGSEIPGVIVQHDFYLSDLVRYIDVESKERQHGWTRALLNANGWAVVRKRFTEDCGKILAEYPCNLEVLQLALGVIVHSNHSRQLACRWYGENAGENWIEIPHLRAASTRRILKEDARKKLDIKENDFVLCSFGIIGRTKHNHRVLAAWLASPLSRDSRCHLVFVGENDCGDYGKSFLSAIDKTGNGRIMITGYAENERYRTWLAAADAAVQLRALSRGETSGTVLDCMASALPTIINAHGSMAELPSDSVWMLEENFSDQALIDALTSLWEDANKRQDLGRAARQKILRDNNPRRCAEQYRDAIERFYAKAQKTLPGAMKAIAQLHPTLLPVDWTRLAKSLAANFPLRPRKRHLFLDVTGLADRDAKTGIQRVTRALLQEITLNPPEGWTVEPVFGGGPNWQYRYARRFMCRFLGIPDDWAEDEMVEAWPGDIFLGLDFHIGAVSSQKKFLQDCRQRGVFVKFIVHDLLPVKLPEVFPERAQQEHQGWLEDISCFDGALCVSRSVADEFHGWLQAFGGKRERPYALHWFHHGADIGSSAPTTGVPLDADRVLATLRTRPSFLMVGTIEPRKGYLQTIAAFEQLWARGIDVNLVIVGAEGWKDLPDAMRRNIPQIVRTLSRHPELGKRLFWLDGISDEYLDKVYVTSSCLVAASEDEGFGLPLIEAARHGMPLLVRDIPVFREVTAGHAYFFPDDLRPDSISTCIEEWLSLYRQGRHPKGDAVPHQTWKESARQVVDAVLGKAEPYRSWLPDGERCLEEDDRLHTEAAKDHGYAMPSPGDAGYLICHPHERLEARLIAD